MRKTIGKIFMGMLFICAGFCFAEPIVYTSTDEVQLLNGNYEPALLLDKNVSVYARNMYGADVGESPKGELLCEIVYNGINYIADASKFVPQETKCVFDEGIISSTLKNDKKALISKNYVDLLFSQDRDAVSKIEPYGYEQYNAYKTEFDYEWFLTVHEFNPSYIFNVVIGLHTIFGYYSFYVLDIEKESDGYKISSVIEKYWDVVVEPTDPQVSGKKQILTLTVDGDYLTIRSDEKMYGTFVIVSETLLSQGTSLLQNNTCDPSKVTWPRHADGSCDYDDKIIKTHKVGGMYKTEDNIRLRAAEGIAGDALATLAAGTRGVCGGIRHSKVCTRHGKDGDRHREPERRIDRRGRKAKCHHAHRADCGRWRGFGNSARRDSACGKKKEIRQGVKDMAGDLMKKNCIFTLFALFASMHIFATDIRQVMFGNNYETIKEIDADSFLDEYPDIKNYVSQIELGDFMMREHDKEYFRCFAQTIGNKRFVRVVKAVNPLSDEYILSWRNPDKISSYENHVYITQMFCLPEERTAIAILPFCKMDADGYAWENGTDSKYEMIEIIQRNENVKGFLLTRLVDRIDHHNRAEENGIYAETYINTAEYYLFDDVISNATENFGKVKYARNYSNLRYVSIEASQPLVDSKRPFMYTINNAFDGNAGTAYVENTEDDLFEIYIGWENSDFTKNAVDALKITNGYAKNKELYYANNRIKCIQYYSWDDDAYKKIDIDDRKDSLTITLARFSGTFSIVDKYKGDKYNDTCVSEIDFHFILTGWLFGD